MGMQVQMRALVNAITMDGGLRPRQIFWCSQEHAAHYAQHRIAEYIAPPVGPSENTMAAPAETKKSLPEEQAGQSTASAPSSAFGTGSPLYAPLVGQALPQRKPILSLPRRGKGRRR